MNHETFDTQHLPQKTMDTLNKKNAAETIDNHNINNSSNIKLWDPHKMMAEKFHIIKPNLNVEGADEPWYEKSFQKLQRLEILSKTLEMSCLKGDVRVETKNGAIHTNSYILKARTNIQVPDDKLLKLPYDMFDVECYIRYIHSVAVTWSNEQLPVITNLADTYGPPDLKLLLKKKLYSKKFPKNCNKKEVEKTESEIRANTNLNKSTQTQSLEICDSSDLLREKKQNQDNNAIDDEISNEKSRLNNVSRKPITSLNSHEKSVDIQVLSDSNDQATLCQSNVNLSPEQTIYTISSTSSSTNSKRHNVTFVESNYPQSGCKEKRFDDINHYNLPKHRNIIRQNSIRFQNLQDDNLITERVHQKQIKAKNNIDNWNQENLIKRPLYCKIFQCQDPSTLHDKNLLKQLYLKQKSKQKTAENTHRYMLPEDESVQSSFNMRISTSPYEKMIQKKLCYKQHNNQKNFQNTHHYMLPEDESVQSTFNMHVSTSPYEEMIQKKLCYKQHNNQKNVENTRRYMLPEGKSVKNHLDMRISVSPYEEMIKRKLCYKQHNTHKTAENTHCYMLPEDDSFCEPVDMCKSKRQTKNIIVDPVYKKWEYYLNNMQNRNRHLRK